MKTATSKNRNQKKPSKHSQVILMLLQPDFEPEKYTLISIITQVEHVTKFF